MSDKSCSLERREHRTIRLFMIYYKEKREKCKKNTFLTII